LLEVIQGHDLNNVLNMSMRSAFVNTGICSNKMFYIYKWIYIDIKSNPLKSIIWNISLFDDIKKCLLLNESKKVSRGIFCWFFSRRRHQKDMKVTSIFLIRIFLICNYVFSFHQPIHLIIFRKSIKVRVKKLIVYELFNILCQYMPE